MLEAPGVRKRPSIGRWFIDGWLQEPARALSTAHVRHAVGKIKIEDARQTGYTLNPRYLILMQ